MTKTITLTRINPVWTSIDAQGTPCAFSINTSTSLMYNHLMRALLIAIVFGILLTGCTAPEEAPAMEPFSPPTLAATPTIPATAPPTPLPPSPTPVCENDLTFVADLSIPDGTVVEPGDSLDKRWQVRNSGTCSWDARYSLVRIAGDEMGAAGPFALYPALAGAEAAIQIIFTAPDSAGTYRSAWQAAGADGSPFGDPVFIEIIVP